MQDFRVQGFARVRFEGFAGCRVENFGAWGFRA